MYEIVYKIESKWISSALNIHLPFGATFQEVVNVALKMYNNAIRDYAIICNKRSLILLEDLKNSKGIPNDSMYKPIRYSSDGNLIIINEHADWKKVGF